MEPLLSTISDLKTFSDTKNPFLRMLDMSFQFFRNAKSADLILIDVYSTRNFYYAFVISGLSWAFSKKYVLLLHGGYLPKRLLQSPIIFNFMLKNAFEISAPSNYLKSIFEEKGFRVSLLPNCLDQTKFTSLERTSFKPNLLYVRGFGSLYNPMMAVKAIGMLKVKFPEIKLIMYGYEDLSELLSIQNYILKEDLKSNIEIHKNTSRESWVANSIHSDIMISCPEIDNTPLSILEGMALGLAIISTNVGGIPFLLTQHQDAILIPSNNELELANVVESLINYPDKTHSMTLQAKKTLENYTWNTVKPLWENLFDRAS